MDAANIARALSRAGEVRVAVFGDYCLDKYLYMDPERDEKSVETGLMAWQIHEKKIFPGAGGTVANNLRALGVQVKCIGLMGEDGEGYELEKALENIGADTRLMVKSDLLCTSTYTKPMRLQSDGSWQEQNRLDFRNFSEPPKALQEQLLHNLEACLKNVDAVILLDQFFQRNLGVITDYVRDKIAALAQKYPDVIFYADSRSFIREFRNVIVKCNNFELMAGQGDPEDTDALKVRAKELAGEKAVFVTRGSRGMLVLYRGEAVPVPAFRVEGPIDIVGAGDASSAGIVLGLSLGLQPEEAALLGCAVSSITIQQIGVTGTASVPQVQKRLSQYKGGEL
ncbi:MAG: hypothetical protein J6J12_00090 [Oscillospiraceae bacterium]|nr:hypothetical protein [Oscillospiraceae bacterium]